MSIVKINAITVPPGSGDELARRFAARAGAMEGVEGFLGFELLRPSDGRTRWLVVTRWRDEVTYEAWVGSTDFAAAHGRAGGEPGGTAGPGGADAAGGGTAAAVAGGIDTVGEGGTGPAAGAPAADDGGHAGTATADGAGEPAGRRPVGTSAELWSFTIAAGSGVD
ncbi:antibiotic biosynthesis monooxygenase [Georgenia sp. TF02-10]|uniref:antibiotic biosynthesis monooxygenase family protein n=1 Tax=Georgenia sp. TF02-10 TaxID=2917725 RepID=UPI00352D4A84